MDKMTPFQKLQDEKQFWQILDSINDKVQQHQKEDLKARWEFGIAILERGPRTYGEEIVQKISSRYKLHVTDVYRRMAFANMFPSKKQLDEFLSQNPAINWTKVVKEILPSVGVSPKAVGNESRRVDKVVGIGESGAMLAEEFVEHAPEDKTLREEAAAGLVVIGSRYIEAGQSLGVEVDMEKPHEIRGPQFTEPTKGEIASLQHFYRTTGKCVVCGVEGTWSERLEFHHFPHTRGAGGKDWQGVPVCPGECHKYAQENPVEFREHKMGAIMETKDRLIFQLFREVSGAKGMTR